MDALGDLEARLADRGLRLGVDDRLRLRVVDRTFDGAPSHRDALAAVVVKRKEERGIFEDVYEAWRRSRTPAPVEAPAPRPLPWDPADTPATEAARRVRAWGERWWAVLPAALLLGVALAAAVYGYRAINPEPDPTPKDTDVIDTNHTEPAAPAGSRLAWVPQFGVPRPQQGTRRWDLLALAVFALSGLALATEITLARRELPEPPPPPPPLPTPPPRPAPTALLLDRGDQEALHWGIAQHAAEEPTTNLDIARTIDATASNAGIPTLRHHRRRAPLGAWLWVDRPGTKELRRFAAEVRNTLEEAGLPVRVADFHGVPDKLADEEAGPQRLQDIPAEARRARVLALTDGIAWAARLDGTPAGAPFPVLDDLRTWEQFTVVDFGAPPLLPARLAPWRIAVVGPEQAVDALSGEARRADRAPAALARWEELCALGGERVTSELALRLRAESGLDVPPWWVHNLLGGLPRRVAPPERAALLRRASEALGLGRGAGVERVSLPPVFQGWLEAWRRARPGAPDPSGADVETGVFLAALQLWDDPQAAIPALYGWTQRGEGARVRAAVGYLAPADAFVAGGATILPWGAADLGAELQPLLAAIGLGADVAWAPVGQVEQPRRRVIGWWLLAGAASGAAVAYVVAGVALPDTRVVTEGGVPALTEASCAAGKDNDTCTAASSSEIATFEVAPGSAVPLRWERVAVPCYTHEDGLMTWRCGPDGEPPHPAGRPERVSVHAKGALRGEVEYLALELLKGTADIVTAGNEDPRVGLHEVHVVIDASAGAGADLHGMYEGLRSFTGVKDAEEVEGWRGLSGVMVTSAESAPLMLAGTQSGTCGNGIVEIGEDCDGSWDCRPNCRTGPAVSWTELVWVTIPAGSSTIGTKDAIDDEGPQWNATFPTSFEITATEVTNAQYRRRTGENKDQLPVTGVTWHEASAFCEASGGRLPTEVEWEYAARAGSTTKWAFGDDEARLAEYAWYDANSGGKTHPVATRRPNEWGLYDLHGNAWEWVEDAYSAQAWARYRDDPALRASLSPIAGGSSRVVRGGSFLLSSKVARSADRAGFAPSLRAEYLGFRCVLDQP